MKYEGEVKLTSSPPQEKLPSKSPALLGVTPPGFIYIACGRLTKNEEKIQKFKGARDTNYIYKNELDKGCFQHDKTYGDFKDLAKRTVSGKVLRDKTFNIAKKS